MGQAGHPAPGRPTHKLDIPEIVTPMPLPPRSPELNPVETFGQLMPGNRLSNRVFKTHADILDHCCIA